jgi:tricarballylate dehydrogenase
MTTQTDHVRGNDAEQRVVLVAGFGAAGGVAALAAAAAGAKVVVCERAPVELHGGSTRGSTFYMRFASVDELKPDCAALVTAATSPWPAQDDEPFGTAGIWGVDRGFLDTWLREAIPTVGWLREIGIGFSFQESDVGDPPGVMPDGGGKGLLDALEAKVAERGVTVMYETALVGLNVDDTGAVRGALLETPEGRHTLSCDAVIVATGGIHGNLELMTRYLGPRARFAVPCTRSDYFNQGEGLRLALQLGAATAGDFGEWHAIPVDARADGRRAEIGGYELGILVNRAGERFVDESSGEPAVKAVREQDLGIAFAIIDERARRLDTYRLLFFSPCEPVRANTIEELATAIDVPAEALVRTIRDFNAACERDAEGDSARDGLPIPRCSGGAPIVEAPFEAWPIKPGIVLSLGGLKVDEHGRVLSHDGRPIAGLYAAGDTAGGYFNKYIGYTATFKALVLGRLSGMHAAGRELAVVDAGAR